MKDGFSKEMSEKKLYHKIIEHRAPFKCVRHSSREFAGKTSAIKKKIFLFYSSLTKNKLKIETREKTNTFGSSC